MNAPYPDPPRTPTKATGNGGAGRVDPDGQMNSESDDSNECFRYFQFLDETGRGRLWHGNQTQSELVMTMQTVAMLWPTIRVESQKNDHG